MTDDLGKIMMATDPADVATLAMIEAMRQIADNGKATNRLLEAVQSEIGSIQTELRDVRERVIRIEASEFKIELNAVKAETERLRKDDLQKIDHRVTALEMDKAGRGGAKGVIDTIMRSPTLGWLVGAAITAWAILTGKVNL